MRTHTKTPSKFQPLGFSLARLRSAAAVAAALLAAAPESKALVTWDGNTLPTPGDGFLWTDVLNWSGDAAPFASDDVLFGNPLATVGVIQLGASQTVNSLAFTEDYTLGAYGTNQVLTNTSGLVSVETGNFVTMNASYGGINGITLSGGGSLFMNHPLPLFGGNITVDGTVAGTTLVHRNEGPLVQYSGLGGSQEFGRFDSVTLGYNTATKTINLINGGEYKIIGTGNNNETGHKNVVIGAGGGTYTVASGFQLMSMDDVGQISNAIGNTLTKSGRGRMGLTGALADANPLGGDVVVSAGMLDFSRLQGAGGANTRFSGMTGTTSGAVGTNVLTINSGGTVMINNGTVGTLDVATVNLNGGTLAGNGAGHEIGVRTQGGATPASTLQINAPSYMMTRDLYGTQTARNFFINSDITGGGTLNVLPSTNAGGTSRLVIQRSVVSSFTGIFRLNENGILEANPRFNAVVDTGKVISDGDIEFAGWQGLLDLRDSDASAANVKDYSANEVSITTTQAGALNTIAPVRATTAAGTGHLFNLGTLTMGSHRLVIGGNNSYQTGFADTASIQGNAVLIMNADNSHAVFSNAAAISEDAAGRSLTIIKAGAGNAAARDVIVGGAISLSNIEVALGTLQLRGTAGGIALGFGGANPTITVNGGANNFTNGLPTQGVLHLDSNGGHLVGATTVIAAGESLDRIVDTATLNMRSNSILRLTSAPGSGTTETIGTTNVSGHATFDIVKTGTPTLNPVALTMTAFNMVGASPTANFTGTLLGLAGIDSSRIILNPPAGTATGFMGAQFHSGNEWAKYDNTVDSGFELGVTPFLATDYTTDATATDAAWAPGQQLKLTSATGTVMTANRNVDRVNLQFGATIQAVNLAGFVLTADQGGLLVSGQTTGIIDGATTTVPSGTAGITSSTGTLYVHNNSQLDIRTPVTGAIDFVKSGTGSMRLTHQNLAVGTGVTAIAPFTAATWSSTLTGSWIINDGRLDVHRGQFLGGRPIVLNGGHLEINQPVSNANADSIITGWANDVTINGNATVAADDNGESDDGNSGDRAVVLLGSLTINNGAILSHGAFSDIDIAYMGGATFAGTPTLNAVRAGVNSATIIKGALAGSGFNMTALNGNSASLVLGGGAPDVTANTYSGVITSYAGTIRLNKANGTTALTDSAAPEDIILNGGAIAWGPGQHGNLSTTNSITITNNGLTGLTPMSFTAPFAGFQAGQGQNQIADTASITLLFGTLGEADRFNNETFGNLTQKNGTLNVGLGTMEITTATVSGGAIGMDRGATFKVGTLTLLPGAPDINITTGIAAPGLVTTMEIGAGGVSLSGQNIFIGTGSSGAVAGAGAVLRLLGNVTYGGSDLLGGSYGRKGIEIQTGSSFREIGTSRVDLGAGTRNFSVGEDSIFFITAPLTNGGLSKSGAGSVVLQPYLASTFAGAVTVNDGVLSARADGAFGTSAGGVTVNAGGTVKIEGSWVFGDAFTLSGQGALIPGTTTVREPGALVNEMGTNRLTAAVILAGNATIASNTFIDPSVVPGVGGAPYKIGNLILSGAGGVTGAGTLTLSGHADGTIVNGVNTGANALIKEGAGRWTIAGASGFTGQTTIKAGNLRITNGAALGGAATGTTVLGGALELAGVAGMAEPLNLYGDGSGGQSGALVNVGGISTLTGAITLGANATLRSDAGTLALGLGATVSGTGFALTLTGNGDGSIVDDLMLGSIILGDAVTKSGRGTWTLSGAGAFSGSTAVNAGTLNIASPVPALHTLSPLNMGGGTVTIAPAAVAQTVGLLNLTGGGSAVNGGVSGLSVGNISRNPGATVTFTGLVNAASATNTNDILGGYATVGSDWARLDGGNNVVALATYVDLASITALSTDNSSATHFQLLSAPATRNTLKITGGNGLNIGGNNLTLTGGGLMYASSSLGGIGGTGVIEAATSGDELIVNVSGSGTLDIAAPLIGAGGGFTKTGGGRLVLSGSSNYSGAININGGTLSIVGPGGSAHPTALGSAAGPRNLNINGGTFEVVGGDYDSGATNMYYVIGGAGGTIRSALGSMISINDGTGQLSGSGDLRFTGGGRYFMSAGAPTFPNYTGNVTVDGGVLIVANSLTLGGRADQTVTLKSGSALVNGAATGTGTNGLPNNLIIEGGVEVYGAGGAGSRGFSGTVDFSGTNTIVLMDRDALAAERGLVFNGRVSGTGVTLDVFGAVNNTAMYLADSSNDLTGTINVNHNAVLEARTPGSLGMTAGGVTVNLNGANSRFLLRHYQNGDYHANVTISNLAEIGSDRLANYAGGANQLLTINDLTVTAAAAGKIVTLASGNTYMTRVAGTATIGADVILNASGNTLFENGIAFTGGATKLDKRGAGTVLLRGAAGHTGTTTILGGIIQLQNGGTMLGTSAIELRGGELRIDNSEAVMANRVNDLAPITIAGGTLRITGAEAIGPMTASAGNSSVFFNQTSETVASTLTIPGLTRSIGATVNFGSDFGGAVGSATLGNARVSSRIIIGGQVNVTGNSVVPGYFGVNGLDFVQYDGTTLDAFTGLSYGVRELRNPTPVNGPTYQDNIAETAWDDADIVRVTSAKTLTASRALEAVKVEAAVTIALATFNLRIETGGIILAGNNTTTFTTTGGTLTAGPAVPVATPTELFISGNNAAANPLSINVAIVNNGIQPVALVKTGTGQLNLSAAVANTYTGGTYLNGGILNLTVNNALGPVSLANKVFLNGGTLQFNIPSASSGIALGGLGHLVSVGGNALIIADNGALAGTNNSLDFSGLAITGPYTLGVRGFDSMDLTFTGTHTFTGTPTIDLAQSGSGSNPNTAGAETFVTLNGAITGSGFYVTSSGNTDNSQARLRIGGGAGDATINSFVGKVIVLPGNFTDDTFVELNKGNVFNPIAITGDLEMNGGVVRYNFDDQIADTSNVLLNRGVLHLNGKSDTIASVTIRSGGVLTNLVTGIPSASNTLSITGDLEVTGYDDYGGVTTGFTVGNNSTVNVGGQIRIGTLGRVHLTEGQTGAILNINGGLQMTGALLTQNTGAGASIIRLSSDVTTFASITPSRIGNVVDSDTFFELNGTRTFTVADGVAGMDLVVSTDIRDSTAPVAAGGLTKAGNGAMQLEGAANANTYSGPTAVNEGALILNKTAGTNAVGNGAVTNTLAIGDGAGGTAADQVILRLSNQIADATAVTVASSGLLDLSTFNASETIGDLTGAAGGAITLGPTSTLTAGTAASTVFAGSITGGGAVTKLGAGSLDLDGPLEVWTINANAGTLNFNTDGNYAVVNANATTNFYVDQTLTALNIAAGVTVTFGDGLPFAGGPGKGAGASAAVPEPGAIGLLLVGALGLLGRRRRG